MQSCQPVGTTDYEPDMVMIPRPPAEGSVYLNTNEVAMCNGTVYGWRYCYNDDSDRPPLELVLGMYRPQRDGTFRLVPGSHYRLRLEENIYSFACRSIALLPSEQFIVQQNDVVAFCEEFDTLRIELYFPKRGSTLMRWDAGGCSESRMLSSGILSQRTDRVFLLSAFIGNTVYMTTLHQMFPLI